MDDRVFDFFQNAFAEDGQFTGERWDYEKFKKALVDKFGRKDLPEDNVKRALDAKLHQQELLDSLKKIDCLYERDRLDKETKFSLFKNQLTGHESSAYFVLSRQPATYIELLKVIADYEAESAILQELPTEVTENMVVANNIFQNGIGRVQILKRQEARSYHIEEKV